MNYTKLITPPLPENLPSEYRPLFAARTPYRVRKPEIRQIRHAFVSHEGLVLKNGLLAKGCAFNLIGKEDNTFYWPYWKLTAEQYAVSRWGKSLPSIHLKGPQPYLLIHSKWFNYAFWVTDSLRRLIQAEKSGWLEKAKLIVPEGWKEIPYVWESLKAFPVEMEIIPKGYHVFVDNLIMPETRDWTASFDPEGMQEVRERITSAAMQFEAKNTTPTPHIYLTRSKRKIRCVENEEELLEVIRPLGFTPVAFENLGFWEQVYLMMQAKSFMSIHGAGFANITFMPAGGHIFELINAAYAQIEYKLPFWKLTHALQHRYFAYFCAPYGDAEGTLTNFGYSSKPQTETDYLVNKNILVDAKQVQKDLLHLYSK